MAALGSETSDACGWGRDQRRDQMTPVAEVEMQCNHAPPPCQGQLHGCGTRVCSLALGKEGPSIWFNAVATILKFLMDFIQWALCFHFALGLTNYAAGPVSYCLLSHSLLADEIIFCLSQWNIQNLWVLKLTWSQEPSLRKRIENYKHKNLCEVVFI